MGNVATPAAGANFNINSNGGAVTPGSGALRLTTGTYLTTVTVTCTSNTCKNNKVNVKIQAAGTLTGRALALTTFNVTMGTATLSGGGTTVSGSARISFTLNSLGLSSGKTFFVGANFPIAGTGTAGDAKSPFTVAVASYNNTPSGGTAGKMEANVYPGITISGASPMRFGGVAKSATGSGTVSMDASGSVTVTGTGLSEMPTTSWPQSAAGFNISGENSAAITITVPASFTMTSTASGSHALTVTTVKSYTGSPPLNSSGSYGFTVGGSMSIPSNTVIGAYTGSISITAAYN